MKTALRRSLHIIHIHAPRKPAKGSEYSNVTPVPVISQRVAELEAIQENHGRTFKANPFDDRSERVAYQVEQIDDRLLDSIPSPPSQRTALTKRKYLFFVKIAAFIFLASNQLRKSRRYNLPQRVLHTQQSDCIGEPDLSSLNTNQLLYSQQHSNFKQPATSRLRRLLDSSHIPGIWNNKGFRIFYQNT